MPIWSSSWSVGVRVYVLERAGAPAVRGPRHERELLVLAREPLHLVRGARPGPLPAGGARRARRGADGSEEDLHRPDLEPGTMLITC